MVHNPCLDASWIQTLRFWDIFFPRGENKTGFGSVTEDKSQQLLLCRTVIIIYAHLLQTL